MYMVSTEFSFLIFFNIELSTRSGVFCIFNHIFEAALIKYVVQFFPYGLLRRLYFLHVAYCTLCLDPYCSTWVEHTFFLWIEDILCCFLLQKLFKIITINYIKISVLVIAKRPFYAWDSFIRKTPSSLSNPSTVCSRVSSSHSACLCRLAYGNKYP